VACGGAALAVVLAAIDLDEEGAFPLEAMA